MFTGLIQSTSQILAVGPREGGMLLKISRPAEFENLKLGESIAVDGVCLTLTKFEKDNLDFFVGAETLEKTFFSQVDTGWIVNLERSLTLADRLGGHLVTGHVDGVARVLERKNQGECLALTFQVSREQFRWIVTKGSICINGVSLTVNNALRNDHRVEVLLIPETLTRTNLGRLQGGSLVNVECDQTVKIIARQMEFYGAGREHNT